MKSTFFCIDGHTCGNPVRVVAGGAPRLEGANMIERRAHFEREFDWIRTSLMFEPRGHEVMSGSILYPPTRSDCDVAILFIEVSGCLPMCGHGTIGTVTTAIEHGLVRPREPGVLRLDTPAGLVVARYKMDGDNVDSVQLINVPSFLHSTDLTVDVEGLGEIRFDVAYGGNFYAIVEAQKNFGGLHTLKPSDIQRLSPILRQKANEKYQFVHPEKAEIRGLSHVMWTGEPTVEGASARNAVFYVTRRSTGRLAAPGLPPEWHIWSARASLRSVNVLFTKALLERSSMVCRKRRPGWVNSTRLFRALKGGRG